ncbi:MAG: hypothetical protein AAF399_23990 [Bacteroidota bacterium]
MTQDQHDAFRQLLPWHRALERFEYNLVVDWAMDLIERETETDHVLIVASFAKPVDATEIRPYVSGMLRELGIAETYGEYSVVSHAYYHIERILLGQDLRQNLENVYHLYLQHDRSFDLHAFYLLYYTWCDLESEGVNYYYEGASLDNIEELLREEARTWIDQYVHGKHVPTKEQASLLFLFGNSYKNGGKEAEGFRHTHSPNFP